MRSVLLAPTGSARAAASPARRRCSPGLAARRRSRCKEPLRLAAAEPAEADEGRSILPRGRGTALLPLHDGGRAHADQAGDRGLAEGESLPELPDEAGRQPRGPRLVLRDTRLPPATGLGLRPARRDVPERRDLRAQLTHRLTEPTHV